MSSARRGTRAPWAVTFLMAVATFLGINALQRMIEFGPWMRTLAGVIGAVAVAVVLTRLVTRSRLLPTFVGGLALVAVMLPVFVRTEDGGRAYLPTPSALRGLAATFRDAVTYAETTVAPAPMNTALLAVLTAAFVAAFLIAEHLAVSWRLATVAGLFLLIPWLPAVALQHRVDPPWLLGAIAAWVAALALTAQPGVVGKRPPVVPALMTTAAVMVAVALVTPTALGGNGWGMIPRFATPEQFETTTRLNLALDLRTSLTTQSSNPVIVYSSTGSRPDSFRLYTLAQFDGQAWERPESVTSARSAEEGVLWPSPVTNWSGRTLDRVDVQVLGLAETNLPLPPVPRMLDVPDGWNYASSLDEVISTESTTQNLAYTIQADMTYFDEVGLRVLGDASGEDASLPAVYLDIPPAVDEAGLRALAEEVTAGATTRYDQALMLQDFFRDPAEFQYDTAVQPSGADSVSVFLNERAGYCVQFGTAMVMMLRTLGIPARLAVGFLPGSPSDGTYLVRGGDAHAWPEVYFEGTGFVRFEPTPSVQTGAPPAWANSASEALPVPSEVLEGAQNPNMPIPQPGDDTDPLTSEEDEQTRDEAASTPTWVIVVAAVAVLLVLAAIAAVLAWRHRTRSALLRRDPESVWERLRVSVPEEASWPTTLTPHEAQEWVERAVPSISNPARASLGRLAAAVSDHRYAPQGTQAEGADIVMWADEVRESVVATTEGATGRPARGGDRVAARSAE